MFSMTSEFKRSNPTNTWTNVVPLTPGIHPFIYIHSFSYFYPTYSSFNLSSFHNSSFVFHFIIYPSIPLSIYPFIYPSIYSFIHLSIYPSIYLSIFPSIYLSILLSISIYIYIYIYI